jgi:hypothetical protein
MAVVKIINKENLEKLIAKLTLRLGRKPTQQDVLDHCVLLGEENFEILVKKLNPVPVIDDQKFQRIIAVAEELKDVPWLSMDKIKLRNKQDQDIYSV